LSPFLCIGEPYSPYRRCSTIIVVVVTTIFKNQIRIRRLNLKVYCEFRFITTNTNGFVVIVRSAKNKLPSTFDFSHCCCVLLKSYNTTCVAHDKMLDMVRSVDRCNNRRFASFRACSSMVRDVMVGVETKGVWGGGRLLDEACCCFVARGSCCE
jgi:hypothetical protein